MSYIKVFKETKEKKTSTTKDGFYEITDETIKRPLLVLPHKGGEEIKIVNSMEKVPENVTYKKVFIGERLKLFQNKSLRSPYIYNIVHNVQGNYVQKREQAKEPDTFL